MNSNIIRQHIQALPETAAWPELVSVFERVNDVPRPDWELPLHACQAVGREAKFASPGAAALACMQISIMLVDDMLDEDPRGEYLRRGYGAAANLAQAFQAAAFRLVEHADVSDAHRVALAASLAHLGLATAQGQHLDVQNLQGEESYWRVVRAKSTPFYGAALRIGALLGEASQAVGDGLYDLGVLIGEIIQIEDDLGDVFQVPANADWLQGRNNLLIMYARTADHPDRVRFEALLADTQDPAILTEAQQILVSAGAVSYCAYLLVDRYQAARRLLDDLALPDPSPILTILDNYADSLLAFLRLSGIDISKTQLL